MIVPKIPFNEKERLENLKQYYIIDTVAEKEYDEITFLASQICNTPISLISLIDDKRQWFKSHYGLNQNETPKEQAFCAHAINEPDDFFIVPDSRLDERFHDNPLVTNNPNIVFYAGYPLVTVEGYPLGTLCVIDNVPRELSEAQLHSLEILGNHIIKLLELRISIKELEKTKQSLIELNTSKNKLFSIIGHDLRGPIGGFKDLVEFLLKDFNLNDSESLVEILKMIQKSSNSTYDLLENLLTWAKSQLNEVVFNPEIIDLNELVSTIHNLFSEATRNKGINLLNNIPEKYTICADKNMLSTVIRNLISNAIKFSSEGMNIKIKVDKIKDEIIIKVIDEGVGIKQENLEKLFKENEFFTTYGTNGEKGTGLGLTLCKEFVKRHHGKIWVESEYNKGSIFSFSLPTSNIMI